MEQFAAQANLFNREAALRQQVEAAEMERRATVTNGADRLVLPGTKPPN